MLGECHAAAGWGVHAAASFLLSSSSKRAAIPAGELWPHPAGNLPPTARHAGRAPKKQEDALEVLRIQSTS